MPTDKKPLANALPWNGKLPEGFVGEEFDWDGGRFLVVRRTGGVGMVKTAQVCQKSHGGPHSGSDTLVGDGPSNCADSVISSSCSEGDLSSHHPTLLSSAPPVPGAKSDLVELRQRLYHSKKDPAYISLDSEYISDCALGIRHVLSWQVVAWFKGKVDEFVIIPLSTEVLSLRRLIWYSLYCVDALPPAHDYKPNSKASGRKVVFLAHNALADVSTLRGFQRLAGLCLSAGDLDNKTPSSQSDAAEVNGGLVSINPVVFNLRYGLKSNKARRTSVIVRDSMLHLPPHHRSLAELGESVGLDKIALPDGVIEHMDKLRDEDFGLFYDYGLNDSKIVERWVHMNYEGCIPPMTSSQEGAQMLIAQYPDKKAFLRQLRGVEYVPCRHHDYVIGETYMSERERPLSPLAETIQREGASCYSGGMNQSMAIGYYPETSYDYDLAHAYPMAMMMADAPDWDVPFPAAPPFIDEDLTMDSLDAAIRDKAARFGLSTPGGGSSVIGVGHCDFEFPADVYLPCIPVRCGDSLVFPHVVHDGWATLPEVVTALQMGAKVHANVFTLYAGSGTHPLAQGLPPLQKHRDDAALKRGKDSAEANGFKVAINSVYGKISQNVVGKSSRSLTTSEMEELNPSCLTSPIIAAYVTAIVRCMLCAAIVQLHELGYCCYSVTTDGFITNAPFDVLDSLDLFGWSELARDAEKALSGNPTLWTVKHENDGLLNISTRVNVGLDNPGSKKPGVFAATGWRNSRAKSSGPSSDAAARPDKDCFLDDYLTHPEGVTVKHKEFPTAVQVFHGVVDYVTSPRQSKLKLNFDFKRVPDISGAEERSLFWRGTEYRVLTYETAPFEDYETACAAAEARLRLGVIRSKCQIASVLKNKAPKTTRSDLVNVLRRARLCNTRLTPLFAVSSNKEVPVLIARLNGCINEWCLANNVKPFAVTPQTWRDLKRQERLREESQDPFVKDFETYLVDHLCDSSSLG